METMSEQEHYIRVRSLQEWHGEFSKSSLNKNHQMELEPHGEISTTFTCTCGDKFYKKERAEEHLEEQ